MKSAGKMTSLLPWLFQDSSRRGAKKRRDRHGELPLVESAREGASLDGDTAMVTAAIGDRVHIEERPVAVAVREALFSMSRGGGPRASRSDSQRVKAEGGAAMNRRDDTQRDPQTERGETEAHALPAASLPSLDDALGDAVAAEGLTEPMTAQESMVASLGAHRLGAHRLASPHVDAPRLAATSNGAMRQAANPDMSELASRPAMRTEISREADAERQGVEAMTSERGERPSRAQGAIDESSRRSTGSTSVDTQGPASNDPNDDDGSDDETPPDAGSVANTRAANDETTLSLVDRLQQLEQRSALASQQAMLDRVYQEALKSELFDPQWYQATYRQTFDSPRAAFDDYLRKSRFAPVNPSSRFDSETYHRMYMDVFHAQQSPLQHYLLHGRTEGRVHAPATVRWFPREVIEPAATLSEAASELKIALCLHVFYDDFIDRFANAIAAFPVTVDVFLTLADAQFETRARTVFEQHARVGRVETRVVPNRGRNFGPMLVEYGPALDEYDLLCHLHSKKSLYSGKEQTQWAEYLIEYLLRDVSVMTRLLNAFADDDTLGMYYPTTFWMMPGWVNHLTMNKGAVRDWQNRLGLGRIPDFLSYPAGGMFWARPKALEGVFDQTWAYDDFPAEPLPNDDSMLHALERVIGPLVEHLGYRQLFFYPPTGQFTTDNGYITSSYHGHLDHHLPSIQAHPCVSFDVFDTLVRRRYTIPDYAKLKLGARLQTQGIVESAQAFVALRNQAESDLRRRANFQGDVRIADIYTEIAERLGVENSQAQSWMNQEFELDLEMILPKDEMVELFNHLAASGHILWVISDSYYTRDQVGLMLRKAGVSAAYRLMVSSEEQARKDNGTLWHKVKQDLAREGISRHLHIGDNVVADAQRPGDMGMTTFHILHPMDKWRALGFPDVLEGGESLDEQEILKWGRLISEVGRNPFIGQ